MKTIPFSEAPSLSDIDLRVSIHVNIAKISDLIPIDKVCRDTLGLVNLVCKPNTYHQYHQSVINITTNTVGGRGITLQTDSQPVHQDFRHGGDRAATTKDMLHNPYDMTWILTWIL